MRNFQDTFEIRKRSFISAFSICMTVPLGRHNPFFALMGKNIITEHNLLDFVCTPLLHFLPTEKG